MRILGFSKKWDKLQQGEFTTFRYPRKDRDWQVGEVVKVVYKPRSKEREVLGTAEITAKNHLQFGLFNIYDSRYITTAEAQMDGFTCYKEMKDWFYKQYGGRIFGEPINKLTLKWEAVDEPHKN